MFKTTLSTLLLTLSTIAIANPVTVSVGAQAHDYFSMKGDYVSTSASHDIEIINNSDSAKTFTYVYRYCAEGHNECAISYNTVTVNAHTKWNNHHDSIVSPKYDYVGKYNLTATTNVNGQNATSYGSVIVR
jgi:ABC-type molybdate transport system substrate-binding protein